jgi:hypothetical protein
MAARFVSIARELHEFLVGRDFTSWIKSRITKCAFVAGDDYVVLAKTGEREGKGISGRCHTDIPEPSTAALLVVGVFLVYMSSAVRRGRAIRNHSSSHYVANVRWRRNREERGCREVYRRFRGGLRMC